MGPVSDPRALPAAWDREHRRIVRQIAGLLPGRPRSLIELGCGRGELTVPLARAFPDARLLAIDGFRGPYARHAAVLRRRLRRASPIGFVRVQRADVRAKATLGDRRGYDAILSKELLPELTAREGRVLLRRAFGSLRPGGMVVEVFLAPTARNRRQSRVIEADSDPRWTSRPPASWFSPRPAAVGSWLAGAGFARVRLAVLPSRLRFVGAAARRQLRDWGVRPSYLRSRARELANDGIELPDWIVVSGVRPEGRRRPEARSFSRRPVRRSHRRRSPTNPRRAAGSARA